jgi:hypothetical protein
LKKIVVLVFISIIAFSFSGHSYYLPTCKEIMQKTIKECISVQGLKYALKCSERTSGNKYNNFGSLVKLNRNPRKIYLNIKGTELLWIQGQNNGKALVKPNKLFMNLNLDPMGSLMRQDQHHTIHEIGFDYIADILDYNVKKAGDKFDEEYKLLGEERANGRPCYKIEISTPYYTILSHTVLKGENIVSIARKNRISEYVIKRLNKGYDETDDLKVGSTIKIPSHYAKKVVIHIDQLYYLPVAFKVYDNDGLFESYDYSSMIVNPKFEADEFSKDFKAYGF